MRKIISYLASPVLMGALALILVVGCALATFIENDFGTRAARVLVYNALWFEVLLLLIAVNMSLAIVVRKLYRAASFPVFLFHVGFVVIIIGAAVTRYVGHEGMLHAREGEVKRSYLSSDSWVQVYAQGDLVESDRVLFSTVGRNRLRLRGSVDGDKLTVSLREFIPRGVKGYREHPQGSPLIQLMVLNQMGSHPLPIPKGEVVSMEDGTLGFEAQQRTDVSFSTTDSGLVARSIFPVSKRQMTLDTLIMVPDGQWFKLEPKVFYRMGNLSFAFRDYYPSAKVFVHPSPEPASANPDYLHLDVCLGGVCKQVYVPHSDSQEQPVVVEVNDVPIAITYGPKEISLPFGIKLNEFVIERYPGSESPSSYISHIEVLDTLNQPLFEYSIYMNNILNYKGQRFFQSSYDPDYRGTYLSVNSDRWGTVITYVGYAILIIGMIWALLARRTRFRRLLSGKLSAISLLFLLAVAMPSNAHTHQAEVPQIPKDHALEFGHIMVQDVGGRIKPLSTLAGEALRKLNRSNRFMDQTPEQIFLGMSAFPEYWQGVPIISVKHEDLRSKLGVSSGWAAFSHFFDHSLSTGSYRLARMAQHALSVSPAHRTVLDKEVLKLDERVNILYSILSGQMARLFPEPSHPDYLWLSMEQASHEPDTSQVGSAAGLFASYIAEVRDASRLGTWAKPAETLKQIDAYQQLHGSEVVPSAFRARVEVWLNRLIPFQRLIPWYGLSGLALLVIAFIGLLSPCISWLSKPRLGLSAILVLGFALHTLAIAMRWYVAGRAPLSNSYETMVYIAWAGMLGGFIFSKRSNFVLPAMALLSTLTLFVAHLSWMDPQITNLVPVLKSYWLTIHVAVITASYGFFGMGAILGLLVMVLYALQRRSNSGRLLGQIKELTVINELGLTLGLYLLTAGCFLGAVWANESWGRYWGWDPKETWTLITIAVYAFIIHMRLIPGFYSYFTFNFAALIALSSVLMTYFGVNYYLSGLHSYAGGDSLPLPAWLPWVVVAVLALGVYAWINKRKIEAKESNV